MRKSKMFFRTPHRGNLCTRVLIPTRKETSYSDQALTFASRSKKKISEGCPSNQVSVSDEKWRPFNCFFSRVGLNTYQQHCTGVLISPQPGPTEKTKGHHFSSDAEVVAVTETWLDGKPSDIFFQWLAKVRVWSLQIVSFLVGLRTYQHPGTELL